MEINCLTRHQQRGWVHDNCFVTEFSIVNNLQFRMRQLRCERSVFKAHTPGSQPSEPLKRQWFITNMVPHCHKIYVVQLRCLFTKEATLSASLLNALVSTSY